MGQIVLECAFLAARRLIFIDGLLQLGQIVQPLLTALRAEHGLIAAFVQDGGQDLRDGPTGAVGRKGIDERDEACRTRAAEGLRADTAAQGREQRTALLCGLLLQQPAAALTDVALRLIDDAQE